jgi:hypothetical protein
MSWKNHQNKKLVGLMMGRQMFIAIHQHMPKVGH